MVVHKLINICLYKRYVTKLLKTVFTKQSRSHLMLLQNFPTGEGNSAI